MLHLPLPNLHLALISACGALLAAFFLSLREESLCAAAATRGRRTRSCFVALTEMLRARREQTRRGERPRAR